MQYVIVLPVKLRKLKDERHRAAGELLLKNLPHLFEENFPSDITEEKKAALIAERKGKQKILAGPEKKWRAELVRLWKLEKEWSIDLDI
ncbi:MAG: hypothetical protein LQ338_007170 [Usnochroma carphineum]|nr:MAG: hypothetical protein LQ338_007170 [Usnochroma carphineum]